MVLLILMGGVIFKSILIYVMWVRRQAEKVKENRNKKEIPREKNSKAKLVKMQIVGIVRKVNTLCVCVL